MTGVFEFVIGFLPNSSKNRKRIAWNKETVCPVCNRGTPFIVTDNPIRHEMSEIAERARAAGVQLIEEDEIDLAVRLDIPRKRTIVRVASLGPPPRRGATGRGKDGDNVLSTICDALNGVAWTDDRQIRRHGIERFPEGCELIRERSAEF